MKINLYVLIPSAFQYSLKKKLFKISECVGMNYRSVCGFIKYRMNLIKNLFNKFLIISNTRRSESYKSLKYLKIIYKI